MEFNKFWELYPNKKNKAKSKEKWDKLDETTKVLIIKDITERKEKDTSWIKGFVPMPTTYFNGKRWEDEIVEEKKAEDKRVYSKVGEVVSKEYSEDRKNFMKLSVDEKARKLGFFRLIYFGFTGRKSEEVELANGKRLEDLAMSIQKKFFSENPKRMFCDPTQFKPLIKSETCHPAVLRITESQIYLDKSWR